VRVWYHEPMDSLLYALVVILVIVLIVRAL
jgi:hypothetical protein